MVELFVNDGLAGSDHSLIELLPVFDWKGKNINQDTDDPADISNWDILDAKLERYASTKPLGVK